MGAESIVARVRRLRAEIAGHKSAMRAHKQQLHLAAAALADLEAECRRRGITLIVQSRPGEGDIHGHRYSD